MPANLRRAAPFLVPFFLEKDHPDLRIEKPRALALHVRASGMQTTIPA
jgi:hypothetical protein